MTQKTFKKKYTTYHRRYKNDLALLWHSIPVVHDDEEYTGIILDGFWLGSNDGYSVIFYEVYKKRLYRFEDKTIKPTVIVEGVVDPEIFDGEFTQYRSFHALKEKMITVSRIRTQPGNYRWNKKINHRQNRTIGTSVDFDSKYFLEKQLTPGVLISVRNGNVGILLENPPSLEPLTDDAETKTADGNRYKTNEEMNEEEQEHVQDMGEIKILDRVDHLVAVVKQAAQRLRSRHRITRRTVPSTDEIDQEEREELVDVRTKLLGEPEPIIELAELNMPFFELDIPHIKRVAFDIEVMVPRGTFPFPEDAEFPVHSVGVYDCSGNSWVYIMGYYPTRTELKLIEEELGYLPEIKTFISESQLLSALFDHLMEYPLHLSYNGDNFDFPYLHNRALNLDIISPIMRGKSRGRTIDYHFRGSIHLDLFRFFVNNAVRIYAFGAKYTRVRLDDVAEALLGYKKVEHDLWFDEMTRDQMVAYTIRDVELTQRLTQYSDELVMKLLIMFMRVGKMTLTSVNRDSISRWILTWIAFEHYRKNWVLPSKKELKERGVFESDADSEGKQYKGAIVFDPDTGVYWDVTVADYASLYPSVIKKFRLSYETLRCSHETCRDNRVPELHHWVCQRQPGITAMLVGFVRDVRVNWYKDLAKTAKTKERRAQAKTIEQALKVFINASYGVFGNKSFSLFCPPVAESTTAYSRYALLEAKQLAEQQGLPVLYGDTDSIFLHKVTERRLKFIPETIKSALTKLAIAIDTRLCAVQDEKSLENAIRDSEGVVVEVDDDNEKEKKDSHIITWWKKAKEKYDAIRYYLEKRHPYLFEEKNTRFRHIQFWSQISLGIPMGIDYNFRFLVLSGRKKNYFGVTEDGEMIVKGLQVKKSNTAIFIREVFDKVKKILIEVETKQELKEAKETMLGILAQARDDLRSGKIPLEKLARMVTLRKNFSDYQTATPAVQVALQEMTELNELEYQVGAQFMVVSTHPRPFVVYTNRFDNFPLGTRFDARFMQVKDITDVMQVAWDKYVEQLKKAFLPILGSFGLSWEGGLEHQTMIDQFFAGNGEQIRSLKIERKEENQKNTSELLS